MSSPSISAKIARLESIADSVPSAGSESELRRLGSQAMGTALSIKEELESHGISAESEELYDVCKGYDYGDDLATLKENLQIVLQQFAGYYRALATGL